MLRGVDLSVDEHQVVCLIGPSGCGKSSLLWIVAGLVRPSVGRVEVLGRPVTGVSREVGIIIQQDALLPWRSARSTTAISRCARRW